jgi:hypothetical protein
MNKYQTVWVVVVNYGESVAGVFMSKKAAKATAREYTDPMVIESWIEWEAS